MLSADQIEKQKNDHLKRVDDQVKMQTEMIATALAQQVLMMKNECERNVTMADQQFSNEAAGQKMALQQQFEQQRMLFQTQHAQHKAQIDQQAMQLTAVANQQKLQKDMEEQMLKLQAAA